MSQDYGQIWEASLVHDLFIIIQVRIFSSMLQQGEVNLEKLAMSLKYAMDAERICKGEITHNIQSVPKLSHLWGKMDFL